LTAYSKDSVIVQTQLSELSCWLCKDHSLHFEKNYSPKAKTTNDANSKKSKQLHEQSSSDSIGNLIFVKVLVTSQTLSTDDKKLSSAKDDNHRNLLKDKWTDLTETIYCVTASVDQLQKLYINTIEVFEKLCHLKCKRMIIDLHVEEWIGYENLSIIKKVHDDTEIELRIESHEPDDESDSISASK